MASNKPVVHAEDHDPRSMDALLDRNFVTVGTPGVDGVDALIAANLPPYDSTPWVPFQNSWTQAGGDEQPLQFIFAVGGWVRIRGVPTGGADNTTVFTLPAGYRPTETEHFVSAGRVAGTAVTWRVEPSGDVIYETQIGGGAGGGETGGDFIQFDIHNVGEWLSIETTGAEPDTNRGIALISDNDGGIYLASIGTGFPVIQMDGGSFVWTSHGPGTGGEWGAAIELVALADDANNGGVYIADHGIGGIAIREVGTSNILIIAESGAAGVRIETADSDIELVLGAVSTSVTISNHLGNPIFRVDEDGDLHGLTGKALTFDL